MSLIESSFTYLGQVLVRPNNLYTVYLPFFPGVLEGVIPCTIEIASPKSSSSSSSLLWLRDIRELTTLLEAMLSLGKTGVWIGVRWRASIESSTRTLAGKFLQVQCVHMLISIALTIEESLAPRDSVRICWPRCFETEEKLCFCSSAVSNSLWGFSSASADDDLGLLEDCTVVNNWESAHQKATTQWTPFTKLSVNWWLLSRHFYQLYLFQPPVAPLDGVSQILRWWFCSWWQVWVSLDKS